jgi:2-oxoglutarate dehydrogenase E2 component (dihydrolipoamide succinyltransferase)
MTAVVAAPRINTNDDEIGVVAWHVEDGAYIEIGQELVDLETSKAVVTIEAEMGGYVRRIAKKGDIIRVGAPLCEVADRAGAAPREPDSAPAQAGPGPTAIMPVAAKAVASRTDPAPGKYSSSRFSRGALQLIESLGLDREDFKNAGLVTARSIRGAPSPGSARTIAPSGRSPDAARAPGVRVASGHMSQRAETVSLGKRAEIESLTIGESGLVNSTLSVYFNSGPIRARLLQSGSFDGNIQPIIIYEISRLLRQWPQFTAYFEGNFIHYYERVDLGIAIDMGKGLKVVTVKDADVLTPMEIFEKTIEYGLKYLDNRIQPDELVGSTLTITDMSGMDVLHFKPLINGKQSAIIGLGGDSEQPGHPMSINMTFDHRVANGREAAGFLKELRSRILSYAPAPSVAAPVAPDQPAPAPAPGGAVSCSRCGIDYKTYLQQCGHDAYMLACFSEEGTLESVCHRCCGGWI